MECKFLLILFQEISFSSSGLIYTLILNQAKYIYHDDC